MPAGHSQTFIQSCQVAVNFHCQDRYTLDLKIISCLLRISLANLCEPCDCMMKGQENATAMVPQSIAAENCNCDMSATSARLRARSPFGGFWRPKPGANRHRRGHRTPFRPSEGPSPPMPKSNTNAAEIITLFRGFEKGLADRGGWRKEDPPRS